MPGFIQTFVPGDVRQQVQLVEFQSVDFVIHAHDALRRRQRRAFGQRALQGLPERREHPIRAAVALEQLPGFQQQIAGEAAHGDACVDQRGLQCAVARRVLRFVAAVPVDFGAAVARAELGEDLRGFAAADDEFRAEPGEAALKLRETVMQPPAAGRARRPVLRVRFEDVQRQDAAAALDRVRQRRVVGDAQIVAEPEDDGVHAVHSAARLSCATSRTSASRSSCRASRYARAPGA